METANPAMVTLARESRTLTQADLAAQLDITQGALSKIENGQLVPSHEVVAKMAAVLNYPESFFYQAGDYRNLPITFYRKRARVPSLTIKAVRARTQIMRMHVGALLRSADIPPLRVPFMDVREWRGDIGGIAAEVRTQWHLPPGPIASMMRSIEDAGIVVMRCDLGTTQVDALSTYEHDGLPPIIFVNPGAPGDRLRFSLAHELAHIILHHHLIVPSEEDTETQADTFAAEFLMPRRDIRAHLPAKINIQSLAQLKTHWRVSIQALITRCRSLDRISERYARTLYAQMNKYGYLRAEPIPVAVEEPALMRELIEFHEKDLAYGRQDLARLLHLHPSELRSLHLGEKVVELRSVTTVAARRPGVAR